MPSGTPLCAIQLRFGVSRREVELYRLIVSLFLRPQPCLPRRLFAALLDGVSPVEYGELLADSHYAIDLADAAAAKILEGVPQ